MALIHVSSVGNPAAACKYRTVCAIEGRSYTLFARPFADVSFASIVQSFAPFILLPWRIGSVVIVTATVPGSWVVTPSSPGWKMVVYPSLASLLTLMSGVVSPGRMSASLALLLNCFSGSLVQYVAQSLVSSSNYTSLVDWFPLGKFMFSGTKFDVAPESITNFICFRLSIRCVHFFDFVCAIDCVVVMLLICSMLSSFLLCRR